MTDYFGVNAGIELAALQRTLTRPKIEIYLRTRMSAAYRSAVEERNEK